MYDDDFLNNLKDLPVLASFTYYPAIKLLKKQLEKENNQHENLCK